MSTRSITPRQSSRSEEHTSELQSRPHLVCRLLLEKKKRRAARTARRWCLWILCVFPARASKGSFRLCFFFNDTATTEIYTLSLHDALPISPARRSCEAQLGGALRTGDVHQVLDRKSTRLNSSHVRISYAVFCLKKNTHDDAVGVASGTKRFRDYASAQHVHY